MGRSGQKLTRLHEAVELGEADDTVWPGAVHEVVRAKLARMVEARRRDQLGQGGKRVGKVALRIGQSA